MRNDVSLFTAIVICAGAFTIVVGAWSAARAETPGDKPARYCVQCGLVKPDALVEIAMLATSWPELTNVVEFTVIPVAENDTLAPL